jgi:zinc protease
MKQIARLIALSMLTAALLLVKAAFALSIPVTEYKLENGLRLVVIEDRRAPVVLHAVVYDVGGADETTGKTGLAHFFEHLMFKGTTKYPNGSFDNLLDENGVERNAFTTLDITAYYERTSPKLLELMMDLEADRMQNLVLTPEIFEQERKVVQEERRQRTDNDAYGTAMEKMKRVMFKTHPYGRPIIGLAEDVAKLTIADAMEFYREHYKPANAIVLVVGDVSPTDVKALAEKYYGPLKNQQKMTKGLRPSEPPQTAAQRLELEDARISEPFLLRSYNIGTNTSITIKEAAAIDVLASILGSNWQSRLIKQLITDEQIASSTSANYAGSLGDYVQFQITASPRRGMDIIALEERIDIVLQDIVEKGVTEAELQDAKNAAEAANVFARDNPVGFGLAVATLLAAGFEAARIDQANAALAELTVQDIQDAAKRVLDMKQSVTLILRQKT